MCKARLVLFFLFLSLAPAAVAKPPAGSGIEPASLDRSVDPAQDFYLFANGGWLKSHPTPPEAGEWGRMHVLVQQNTTQLYGLVMKCATGSSAPGSLEQKLGDFYLSGMDEDQLNNQGLQPLKRDLARIRAIQDIPTLETVVESLHQRGCQPFFNLGAAQDAQNSQLVIGQLEPAGLGLPEQEYYFRTDERSLKQLAAYREHLRQAFRYLGYEAADAKTRGDQVFELEKRLAVTHLTNLEGRDPAVTYHPTTLSGLSAGVAIWSWPAYFAAMGVPAGDTALNLPAPKYLDTFYAVLESTEISILRNYLEWQLLRSSYDYLSDDLAKFRFDFYGKVLTGAPKQGPRNAHVLNAVDRLLAQALGQKYVETYFSAKARTQVLEMVKLITQTLDEDIQQLAWMSPETRAQARAKLASLNVKVGRPDVWKSYAGLKLDRQGYLDNVWSILAFETKLDLAKIGKPVDKSGWQMSPAEVNAYYDPQLNEIVIPSGILQPPFFSVDVDDAINYGALGTVIGHEITHGFDDQGRKFDAQGNVRDWWLPADAENFGRLAAMVEQQFNGYTVLGGSLPLNGKLVLGESIADLGGLRLSYLAYQKLLAKKPGRVVEGFTPDQQFFLGFAHLWAVSARADYERFQVNIDKHPPGRYRVNGPLSNLPAFAKAFKCAPGTPMVRAQPITVW